MIRDLWGDEIQEHIGAEKCKKRTIFDAIKCINLNQDIRPMGLMDLYDPFMVNKALGENIESVGYAVEVNKLYNLPKEIQHLIYLHSMHRISLYSTWTKTVKNNTEAKLLKHFTRKETKELIFVLTDDEINSIILKLNKRTQK